MNKMPELSDERIARIFYGDEYKDGIRVPEYLNKYFKAITYGQRELLEEWVNPYELSEWAQKNLCYEDLHKLIGWLKRGDEDTS